MSDRTGRFFIVGLPGPLLDRATRRHLEGLRPGGVILFARNLEEPAQIRELLAGIRSLLPEVLVWVDAEGGPVHRLEPVLGEAPAGEELARHRASLARRAGRWIGHGLATLGFDADFAPVVDLDRGVSGNALDRRCLGSEVRPVIARARAFLDGLHRTGIGGCLKHFPGLGAAPADTHHQAARVDLPAKQLRRDLAPFQALAARAGAVMVGHAVYGGWDPQRPATFSQRLLGAVLRERLGFEGLAVADDLEMEALAPWAATVAERAEAAFAAGCDALPVCHHLEEALAAARRLEAPALEARRRQAAARWQEYREHLERLRNRASKRTFRLETVRSRLAETVEAARA